MPNPTYQYSNGVDLTRALPALTGRVKWLSDGNSTSGRFFDDGSFHAAVAEQTYTDTQADVNGDATAVKNRFERAVILRTLNAVFSAPVLIEEVPLFAPSLQRLQAHLPQGELVGWELITDGSSDTVARLKRALLHLSAATPLPLYLYELGNAQPIWTQTVNVTQAGAWQAFDLAGCYLKGTQRFGSVYHFGYKPAELQNAALALADPVACLSDFCAFSVQAFRSTAIPPVTESLAYGLGAEMGLNLEVASMYDYTDRVCQNPELFDELVGLTGALVVLETVLTTLRSNATDQLAADNITRLQLQLDLTGTIAASNAPTTTGLRQRVEKAVEDVKRSFIKTGKGRVITLC